MVRRAPNDRLRDLLAEANWSGESLAKAVNAIAAEAGVPTRYGRASVGQWLAGTRPRTPVPSYVAEALTRRLGRLVSQADAGFAGRPAHEELAHRVYRVASLAVPGWSDAGRAFPPPDTPPLAAVRLGPAEVRSATSMLRLFAEAEAANGAGHVRPALVRYLRSTVDSLLRATSDQQATRQAYLSVSAQLHYLAGFMCFDDELHGAAQWHYQRALRLAAEAEDRTSYAITLRAISGQAHVLGHHRAAVRIAESALEALPAVTPPLVTAFVQGQLAVASAAAGDRVAATRHLSATERHMERDTGESGVVGAYHRASFAHQRAAVEASLHNRTAAISALRESVGHRPQEEARARAVTLAQLAELHLAGGELDRAVTTWHRFLDACPVVQSRRATTALLRMRSRLRPYQNVPHVALLLARASAVQALRA